MHIRVVMAGVGDINTICCDLVIFTSLTTFHTIVLEYFTSDMINLECDYIFLVIQTYQAEKCI